MAWGYVLGYAVSRLKGGNTSGIDPSLLLLAGALPDFDIYTLQKYGTVLGHHGIAHSWLAILLAYTALKFWSGGQMLPYLVSTIQHPLFGDFVSNEIPIFFPLSLEQVGLELWRVSLRLAIILEAIGVGAYLLLVSRKVNFRAFLGSRNIWFLALTVPLVLLDMKRGIELLIPGNVMFPYALYSLVAGTAVLSIPVYAAARRLLKRL